MSSVVVIGDALIDECFRRGSTDNITAVVAWLLWPDNDGTEPASSAEPASSGAHE